MKLLPGLAVACLAGLAAGASQETAEVYILRSQSDSSSNAVPQLPRQIARQILFQRIGADHDSLLTDLPNGVDQEIAVFYVKQYGRASPGLFVETSDAGKPLGGPLQLALMIEGATPENLKKLKEALPESRKQAAFAVRDPPSAKANQFLFNTDLAKSGISPTACGISSAFNPYGSRCWNDGVFVTSYDSKKTPETFNELIASIPRLLKLVESGEMEALIIFMPESSRTSSVAHWTTSPPSNLRSRFAQAAESVIIEDPADSPARKTSASDSAGSSLPNVHSWIAVKGAVPSCFQSFNSCVTQTNNCTGGHGECIDRFATKSEDANSGRDKVCFVCRCKSTFNKPEGSAHQSKTHWGGSMCQKIDVSTPFWLIAGFTVTIVGTLSFAIGMLFSVGEEKLPGVIGAGVSRSK